ncbi:MAG: GumC family protein [Synechococcus sp.]
MSIYDRSAPSRHVPALHDPSRSDPSRSTDGRPQPRVKYGNPAQMERQAAVDFIDLQDYWLVLRRRWKPALLILLALPSLAAVYVLLKVPVYEAEGRLLVEVDRATSLTGLGEELGTIETLGVQNNPADTQVEILRSLEVVQDTIIEMGLRTDAGEPLSYTLFAQNLSTESLMGTDVLSVKFRNSDPEKAAAVVNTLMEVYLRTSVRANQRAAQAASQFIEAELPRSEATVAEAEEALRAFKTEHGIVNLTDEATTTVADLSALQNQLAQLQVQLASTTRQTESLQSELGLSYDNALAVVELAQSPGVNEAISQLQQAQTTLATERVRFRQGNPVIDRLEAEVSQLEDVLAQRVAATQVLGSLSSAAVGSLQISELQVGLIGEFIRAELERQSLSTQIDAVAVVLEERRNRANLLPELQRSERELERRLLAANTTYETLLGRQREVEAAENQAIGNARIISQAIPPIYAEATKGKLLVAAATVAGGILAVAAAFALDLLDPSVKSTRDVRKLLPYQAVAHIPNLSGDRPSSWRQLSSETGGQRAIPPAKQQVARAAFNVLQTNLNYSSLHERTPQAIAVSSARPQEGKTTVAANLATTMALHNYRTLLIDGDLYRPKQHEIWTIDRQLGLVGLLNGVTTVSQAIHPVRANLDVMAIGAPEDGMPPSIDYRKLRTIVAILRRQYDRIIFDSPPLLGASDAAILADIADGLLMVARPSLLDVNGALTANDLLLRSGIGVLGLVINDISSGDSVLHPYADYARTPAHSSGGRTSHVRQLQPHL